MLGKALALGEVTTLSDGEIAATPKAAPGSRWNAAGKWCRSVGRPYYPHAMDTVRVFSRTDK